MVDIFNHAHAGLTAGAGFDFIAIISWVLQSAGLFGAASAVVAGWLFALYIKVHPGAVISELVRKIVTLSIPFAIVTLIYVVAVLSGHDVWAWGNYFDFVQVGFAAATGQAIAMVFGASSYITLAGLIDWIKSHDAQTVIAALQELLRELEAGQQEPPKA